MYFESALPAGNVTSVFLSLLQSIPSSEAYFVLPASTLMAVRFSQKLNAPVLISVTLAGTLTVVRLAQLSKACSSIFVTLFGNSIWRMPLFEKVLFPMVFKEEGVLNTTVSNIGVFTNTLVSICVTFCGISTVRN